MDALETVWKGQRRRFTPLEFAELDNSGILGDGRFELIQGEVVRHQSLSAHRYAVTRLMQQFTLGLLERAWVVRDYADLNLPSSLLKPDLFLVPHDKVNWERIGPEHIVLVLEVAEDTLELDQTGKLELYAQVAIEEYWIVNLPARTLEQYHTPLKGSYKSKITLEPGEVASCLAYPDLALEWWQALPSKAPLNSEIQNSSVTASVVPIIKPE